MFQLSGNESVKFESLSKVLGELLTGSEISRLFEICNLTDTLGVSNTKYKRIYNAFSVEINKAKNDQKIVDFIENSCNPVRFNGDALKFNEAKEKINQVLLFMGCVIDDSGKISIASKAKSIDEVNERINKLKAELAKRNIHSVIMKYCSKEYLANDYFHACFEAIKGTFQRIKEVTHLKEDGNKLLDIVFSKDKPLISINNLKNESEIDEFQGLKYLLLYLHKSMRNFEAHETRLNNELELDKVLDVFVCISLTNKYFDKAQPTCFVSNLYF